MKRSRWPKLVGPLALVWAALLARPEPIPAQTPPTSPFTPYQHRALYLFNFAKYTTWPEETLSGTNAPFVLGILGEDPFGKDIDIIKGKPIKGREFLVKHFSNLADIHECQVLYISPSEAPNLPDILKALQRRSILTVSEIDGFLEQDGMVNFVVEKKPGGLATIGFEINQTTAERARLKLETQLLRLAKRVKN